MNVPKYRVAIVSVFIWIGFVGAISFMEAWLKFRAPGITLPLGLGIGKLVFAALNKVELVLSICVIASLLLGGLNKMKWQYLFFVIPFVILIIQTVWLLPELDIRASMHIEGQEVPDSNLHFYYVGLEFIKIICLCVFGLNLLNNKI